MATKSSMPTTHAKRPHIGQCYHPDNKEPGVVDGVQLGCFSLFGMQ